MAIIGYARDSSSEEGQTPDRQIEALTAAGCTKVFSDGPVEAGLDRAGLMACLGALQQGDVLVVLRLEHLGYRAGELIRFASELEHRGIGFRALDTAFDTTAPAGRTFLQIQAALAEMELSLTRQQISKGIAAARARGRKGGRLRLMTPERLRHAQRLMAEQSRSIPSICRELDGMPISTLYHYLRADGSLKEAGRKLLGSESRVPARSSPAGSPAPTSPERSLVHSVG